MAENIWINPIGGLGDALMISGVLKLDIEREPSRKFNLVRRTKYLSILKGHPAISYVGFPPKDAFIIGTDYWSKEVLGQGNRRAFQILARIFNLETPVEERLYFPDIISTDFELNTIIPFRNKNILIAPWSDSPRKEMDFNKWHEFVEKIKSDDTLIIQAGRLGQQYIKGTYSIIGLTTPRSLINVINKCDVVITSDNFIMHTAHYAGVPAIVLWGPTDSLIYGYCGQVHIKGEERCEFFDKCIQPGYSHINYSIPCSLDKLKHCMNLIDTDRIVDALKSFLT
ncbi:MAG: hypothetical protein HQK88_09955 [Nitrospirae bacterium]|nr:hypothetical protein [Nitrospirota bacterium]MBF0617120.1 hypothetical protein [Nitrospirota bacterium]